MDSTTDQNMENRFVRIMAGTEVLEGILNIPERAEGIVVFVHGSGSSRNSPRNQYVAQQLNEGGLATLLFDLLTAEEEQIDLRTRHLRFDIDLLARRTMEATDWLVQQPFTKELNVGHFGASTGAAAALIAAAERPGVVRAVVSRGGRPDLASKALPRVKAPTLLIVGGNDVPVIGMNEQALEQMETGSEKKLKIIPGATHLFEEPGALEQVVRLARDWFHRFLSSEHQ